MKDTITLNAESLDKLDHYGFLEYELEKGTTEVRIQLDNKVRDNYYLKLEKMKEE